MQLTVIISMIFAMIISIFGVLNAAKVSVNFLIAEVDVSLAIIIFASAILGALVMYLLNIVKNHKLKKEIKKLQRKLTLSKSKSFQLNKKLDDSKEKKVENKDDSKNHNNKV